MLILKKLLIVVSLFLFQTNVLFADAPIGMWSDATHNTITLGWTDSSDETEYRIYAVGNTTPLATLSQNTTSYTVNDIHGELLTPVTTYSFRITAIIGGEEVDNPFQADTLSTTTHFWDEGPFRTCINNEIGKGPTDTPYRSELESLDGSIFCQDMGITDISPIADLKYILGISFKNNLLNITTVAPLGGLTQLWSIILSDNNISGPIPSWLENMSHLYYLDISNNDLSGDIPSWIVNIQGITTLRLFNNELTGSIPTNIGNWTELYELDLSDNNLTGIIPSQIGIGRLETLRLNNNDLSGVIPSSIIETNLFNLDLSNNRLSGHIPTNIDNLANLLRIDLSHNELSGPIPSIGLISYPANGINLSYNKLTGEIPSSLGNIFNLRTLHLNNNHLSGEIPVSLMSLPNINQGDMSLNYNCDLFTENAQLQSYLNGTTITGYEGIINTNGNCSSGISPAILMYLLN